MLVEPDPLIGIQPDHVTLALDWAAALGAEKSV
jgi:hypothetical protein